jgi:hypothetical protein
MLSVIIISVAFFIGMRSVIMVMVVMLSVVAPFAHTGPEVYNFYSQTNPAS